MYRTKFIFEKEIWNLSPFSSEISNSSTFWILSKLKTWDQSTAFSSAQSSFFSKFLVNFCDKICRAHSVSVCVCVCVCVFVEIAKHFYFLLSSDIEKPRFKTKYLNTYVDLCQKIYVTCRFICFLDCRLQ